MTPYRRALTDPAYRRAVEERYRGRHSVLDALRWFAGDAADAADGPPSPYDGLDARRAALYRADPDTDEAARVAALLAERDAERAAVLAAVERAGAGRRPPADALPVGTGSRGRSWRPWPVLLLAIPAAVLAFVGGAALAPAIGQRAAPPVPTISAAQAPNAIVLQPTSGGALALFGRDQRRSDLPIATPEGDLVAQTFRRLALVGSTGVVLYGAETTEGQVCLVAITVDARITASCATEADFRVTPASIDISVTRDPSSDDPQDSRTEVTATWWHDGALRATAVS